MRRGLVLPFALVLSLALAAGLTELYDGLEAALGQVRLENPAQAVNALNRAQSLLREEGALPPVLRDAALTNLQEARQFVAQKSAVDLEARLLLVRHLVGKALYDAFLQAQGEEKAALGQRLARATGLPPALVAQARSAPPEEARRLLEARYLQAMAEDLGQALAAQSRPQAYLALARAYARYLIVQDSPQSRLKAQDFVQALALVSTGQPFRPEVQRLLGQIQAWRQDLLSSLQPSTPVPPPAQARPPEPAPSPPSGTQASPEAPSAEAETFYTPGWMDERTAQTVRLAARTLGYNYDFQLLEAVEEVRDEIGLAVTALGRATRRRDGTAWNGPSTSSACKWNPSSSTSTPASQRRSPDPSTSFLKPPASAPWTRLRPMKPLRLSGKASSKVQGRTSGLTSSSPCSRPQAFPGRSSSFWLGP